MIKRAELNFPPEPKKPFYAPGDLKCLRSMSSKGLGVSGVDPKSQVLFVLHHLLEDRWPRRVTGYIDIPLDIQNKRVAICNPWAEVKAEIMRRLDLCFPDGNLILLVHYYGTDLEADAKEYGCALNDLLCDYNRALNYISTGHFEDRPPYKIWCSKRRERALKGAKARWLCLAT